MIHKRKYLYYILRSSEDEIAYILENTDKYYRSYQQAKKKYGEPQRQNASIRMRNIDASLVRLKFIQQRLNFFLQRIALPEYAYGSVRGRNNISNALQHINNNFFLSVDLKDFFPRITHHQVFRMFRYQNFSPDASHVLTKLVTYKGSLPQGPPTSPIIANLVFVETGLRLAEIASKNNITFTSYLDDLTFSSKSDFKEIIPKILAEIKTGRYYLNHKKISYRKLSPEVTGIFIEKGKLTVNEIISNKAKTNPFVSQYVQRVKEANRKCS